MAEYMVFIIRNGCPICGGEVKGNRIVKYYCKKCSLLFTKISTK